MQPRTSLIVAGGLLLVVGFVAAQLGHRQARPEDADLRRSTYLSGPDGARAWADALGLLGVRVQRFRRRSLDWPAPDSASVLALLDPAMPLSDLDAQRLLAWQRGSGGVLAAGGSTDTYLRCFGLGSVPRFGARVLIGGDTVPVTAAFDTARARRSRFGGMAVQTAGCSAGRYQLDTLLVTTGGQPFMLRARLDSGGVAVLLADGAPFTNHLVRDTHAGEFALGLVAGHYRHVVVDEYHQGFGPEGGLVSATRHWLVATPAGWGILQVTLVAVLALAAGAIRFGPARRVLVRKRRSSLEHVHALATALAAARGHDVAVSLIVKGLRRRLAGPGEQGRLSTRDWLASIVPRVRTPDGRAAAERLLTLLRGGADASGVRAAALAVEDVWRDLRP
ncbi:MAG TPA: DUF4350 domain-containing protein [Gemmatimonadales bacterium]|jgi:hypothetical protein|nr:DUF4350 domain-containing protein [Gemmatimonadales bacterium]